MAHGEINHIEFPADDPERAMAFYTAVAGWQFSAMDGMPDYWVFRSGEGYGGGVGKARRDDRPRGPRLHRGQLDRRSRRGPASEPAVASRKPSPRSRAWAGSRC